MRKWIFLLLLLTGCRADHIDYMNAPAPGAFAGVTFLELRDELFEPHCVNCHLDYSKVNSVRQELNSIVNEVQIGKMPPSDTLPRELIDRLKAWAEAGAPD